MKGWYAKFINRNDMLNSIPEQLADARGQGRGEGCGECCVEGRAEGSEEGFVSYVILSKVEGFFP